MQAVKNLLHSDKDERISSSSDRVTGNPSYDTASTGHGSGLPGTASHSSTAATTGDVGSTGIGHNTGSTSGLSSSGTRGTDAGLTSSDSTTGGIANGSTRTSSGHDHSHGHDHGIAAKFDPTASNTTHDHKHLDHVTQKDVRHVEVEEVQREREHDRHIHHVQHHVQPIVDKVEKDEVIHENAVPVTKIEERHTSTQEDRGLFSGLASQHKDTETHRAKERTVVDLGERVHENVHHHVHHVTQPVVQQEVVDRHRIHTTIPITHTTHEAPIIHKSSTHEPVTMESFLSGGGKLGSGIKHSEAGVLNEGECVRNVDGIGEKLARDLNLGGTHSDGTTGRGSHVAADGERHHTSVGAKADSANLTS